MVSVLVPVYNAEGFLARCVDSILAQSYIDFELILANDGSTDKSPELCRKYARQDARVKVITHENMGVAATREGLLAQSHGEFLLYVDSDDWIEPDMLMRMVTMAENADIVFCESDHAEGREDVHPRDGIRMEIWDHDKQVLEFLKHKRMTGMLWNKLIRRSLTSNAHFNPKTGYGEDAEFLWQVLRRSGKMVVTNEILYHHTIEANSISNRSFSEQKYSAIPMWEKISADVEKNYPQWSTVARVSLTKAAVYGMFEAKHCGYGNREHIRHMRAVVRRNIPAFLIRESVSLKFKLYALAVCAGY